MNLAKKVIEKELIEFETHFRIAVKSKVPLLDRIMEYVIKRKGKQIRPMFVFLSAKLGGDITEKSHRAASLVELLHTATLVHDDVVDETDERRGFFSINALWKNKVAVLVGDYLLSKGLLLSLENDDFDALKILSSAVRQMSEGELLQMEKSRTLNITETTYYEIIKGKTASLLASACAAGANSTFRDKAVVEKMYSFGEQIGMAFQIKDDLFDYGFSDIGKPTGNDIKEKKITLPLIYTLNMCSSSEKKEILYIIKNKSKDQSKISHILKIVNNYDGIPLTISKMNEFKNNALNILNFFPESLTKSALIELVEYVINRDK